jgi:hypothetical protein
MIFWNEIIFHKIYDDENDTKLQYLIFIFDL